jgi:hypothetical protein
VTMDEATIKRINQLHDEWLKEGGARQIFHWIVDRENRAKANETALYSHMTLGGEVSGNTTVLANMPADLDALRGAVVFWVHRAHDKTEILNGFIGTCLEILNRHDLKIPAVNIQPDQRHTLAGILETIQKLGAQNASLRRDLERCQARDFSSSDSPL